MLTHCDGFSGLVTADASMGYPGPPIYACVHRVAALLQRWMMGAHYGAVQPSQRAIILDRCRLEQRRMIWKYWS